MRRSTTLYFALCLLYIAGHTATHDVNCTLSGLEVCGATTITYKNQLFYVEYKGKQYHVPNAYIDERLRDIAVADLKALVQSYPNHIYVQKLSGNQFTIEFRSTMHQM